MAFCRWCGQPILRAAPQAWQEMAWRDAGGSDLCVRAPEAADIPVHQPFIPDLTKPDDIRVWLA